MFARITATATLTMMVVLGAALTYVTPATAGEDSSNVTTRSLGVVAPTFVGTAATGCSAAGCSLLTGPFFVPSTEGHTPEAAVPRAAVPDVLKAPAVHAMPNPRIPRTGPDPAPPLVS